MLKVNQKYNYEKNKIEEKKKILELTKNYIRNYGPESLAKKNTAPVSGKVVGEEEAINLVEASLDLWLTSGRFNKSFEKEMANLLNTRYFLSCNSGSSANLLALSALCSYQLGDKKLKEGDEVITCATGFPTTVNPIIQNKLVPVFLDANIPSYNIKTSNIEKALTKKTKAIMIAHALGNPFDLDKIKKIATDNNLYLIEDCCDALGSKYKNKNVGSFGDIATLSFYPAHHITTGEGGGVFCKSSKLKKIIESIRDWGRDCWCDTGCDNTCKKRFGWKFEGLPFGYDHKYTYSNLGYNLKMSDMQAAVGLAQIKKASFFHRKRKANFNYLYKFFSNYKKYFILPESSVNAEPSWFGFPLTIKKGVKINREKLIKYLNNFNVGTRLLFAGNLTRQPYMKFQKYRVINSLKQSDEIMRRTFWIGLYPGLDKTNLQYTCKIIKKFFKDNKFG